MERKGAVERSRSEWEPAHGHMRSRTRAFDWPATPLRLMEMWPLSIRMTVDLMLAMHQPSCICLGPERRLLYNDEYLAILGRKHPDTPGRTLCEVWIEVADSIQPRLDGVVVEDPQLPADREIAISAGEGPERRWFTATRTPIRDENGSTFVATLPGPGNRGAA